MNLRLTDGQSYKSDITALREAIRTNGTKATECRVTVEIANPPKGFALELVLNLAWESDPKKPAGFSSLYTVGLVTQGKYFYFKGDLPWTPPVPSTALPLSGSYMTLGYASTPLPTITTLNLPQAAINLSRFSGGTVSPGDKTTQDFVRCIVALSEALRFAETEDAIAGVLDGYPNTFDPAEQREKFFTNWEKSGHPLGTA